MSHLYRFYIAPETASEGLIELSPEELHHALHVVRVKEGTEVFLFDGHGREISGVARNVGRRDLRIEVGETRQVPAPTKRVTLCQAFLNRDKSTETLIRRCTELGVARFLFFKGDHSERGPELNEKWKRYAIESCKQSRELWLPEFALAPSLEEALGSLDGTTLIATSDAAPVSLHSSLDGVDTCTIIVGPEGDFSETEVKRALASGAQPISLGSNVLRSEVAAMVALTLIHYELGLLG